jgi:DNA-binding transcriptional regulator YhcF (GntR family)
MLNHPSLLLKNYMVNTLLELLNVPVPAAVARARNRFILLFNKVAKEIENERQTLLKKYGELDAQGNLQIDTATGHYKMKDVAAFEKEFDEMTSRTLAIPCIAEAKVDFIMVKQVLDQLETRLTVAQTTVYNEIMEAFEAWQNDNKPAAGSGADTQHA